MNMSTIRHRRNGHVNFDESIRNIFYGLEVVYELEGGFSRFTQIDVTGNTI